MVLVLFFVLIDFVVGCQSFKLAITQSYQQLSLSYSLFPFFPISYNITTLIGYHVIFLITLMAGWLHGWLPGSLSIFFFFLFFFYSYLFVCLSCQIKSRLFYIYIPQRQDFSICSLPLFLLLLIIYLCVNNSCLLGYFAADTHHASTHIYTQTHLHKLLTFRLKVSMYRE